MIIYFKTHSVNGNDYVFFSYGEENDNRTPIYYVFNPKPKVVSVYENKAIRNAVGDILNEIKWVGDGQHPYPWFSSNTLIITKDQIRIAYLVEPENYNETIKISSMADTYEVRGFPLFSEEGLSYYEERGTFQISNGVVDVVKGRFNYPYIGWIELYYSDDEKPAFLSALCVMLLMMRYKVTHDILRSRDLSSY